MLQVFKILHSSGSVICLFRLRLQSCIKGLTPRAASFNWYSHCSSSPETDLRFRTWNSCVSFQHLQLQNKHIIWVWYCFFHCLWLLGIPTISVTLHLAKFLSTINRSYLLLYTDSVLVWFFLCIGFTEPRDLC